MAIDVLRVLKGLLIREATLTPKQMEIIPGGTANTKTTLTSSQTTDKTVTLPDLTGTVTLTSGSQTLTNKTYDLGTASAKALVTTAGIISESTTTATEVGYLSGITGAINTTYVRTDTLGVANGTATLDNNGKLPNSQLTVTAMEWLGNWNPVTNTPTLADGTGNSGDTYRATVAGTVDLGSGNIIFNIGDWVIYNGSIWEQAPAPGAVSSVFGRTGTITAQSGDYTKAQVGLSNVDNTSDVNKPVSTATATAINTAVSTAIAPLINSTTNIDETTLHWDSVASKLKAKVAKWITNSYIVDGTIGSNQLADTGVTAGNYTLATVNVNSKGQVIGISSNAYISAGVFTPSTDSGFASCSPAQYMRIYNTVTVSGYFYISSSSAIGAFNMSLPILSGFAADYQLAGSATLSTDGSTATIPIKGNYTSAYVIFLNGTSFIPMGPYYYQYTYQIV